MEAGQLDATASDARRGVTSGTISDGYGIFVLSSVPFQ